MSDLAFLSMILGTSAAAGVLGALLGLGGGILLVPLLTLFFGVSLPYAMGASILSVIATSCGAAAGHLASGLANMRLGLFLATATVAGALLGASLVGVVPARALQILFGLALAYSALTTIRQLHVEVAESLEADPLAQRFGLDGVYHDQALGRDVAYHAIHVRRDRKSTRLNSSHGYISYAVFCLKKKKRQTCGRRRYREAYCSRSA